ncbi:helix-turn-helix transcriptional regulator [Shewanella surugensis]|uniref:DNA-binding protein n=1 Tax=Shewanella surugensis TaxID=212020 RepID=A0ABT0L935_9GAMM|nr:hypothetical protein [Shewanella surugensis]MCL1124199.1 hypothetical protein [Shewanella surugensis]
MTLPNSIAPVTNAPYCVISEQLLSATQAMKTLGVSRAKFYEIVKEADFIQTVKPMVLVTNGRKQYRYTEIISFIEKKQAS